MKNLEDGTMHLWDNIPLRPPSHLLRALGFTLLGGSVMYFLACKSEYEKLKSFQGWASFGDLFKNKQKQFNEVTNQIQNFSPAQQNTIMIVAVCAAVTLAWQIPAIQPFMWRFFTNSFASKSLCLPMFLSCLSHKNFLHLGVNMYVLYSFSAPVIQNFLGVDQFNAMFFTGGLVSSLVSLIHKSATKCPIRALGASGAICAALVYTCSKMPDARLNIVFLPMFTFSAENAVYGLILFDFLGLVFKWRLFDHAAHLGGSFFGLFYATYGEEWYTKHVRPYLFKKFKRMDEWKKKHE